MRTFLLLLLTIAYAQSLPGVRYESPVQQRRPSSSRSPPRPHEYPHWILNTQNDTDIPVQRYPTPPQASANLVHDMKREATTHHDEYHHTSKALHKKQKDRFISLLAIFSGLVDVVCYRRFGFYVNMMTGNTIRVGNAIMDFRWSDALFFASLVASYTLGAALMRGVDLVTKQSNKHQSTLANLAPVVLAIFCSVDLIAKVLPKAVPAVLALGFGLVNAAALDATKVVTNAASGHWQKVGLGLADIMLLGERRKGLGTHVRVLGYFLASIILSSAAHYWCSAQTWLKLPPMGISFGALYATLLSWYAVVIHHSNKPFYHHRRTPFDEVPRKRHHAVSSI